MSDRLSDADLMILVTVGDEVTLLAREVQASRKLISDLRAVHTHGVYVQELPFGVERHTHQCDVCRVQWPCPTIRLIEEIGS